MEMTELQAALLQIRKQNETWYQISKSPEPPAHEK